MCGYGTWRSILYPHFIPDNICVLKDLWGVYSPEIIFCNRRWVKDTFNDEGCIHCEQLQDHKDLTTFVFLETHKDEGCLKKHRESGHLNRWCGRKQDCISNKPVKCSFWQTDEGVFLIGENNVHAYKKYGFKRVFFHRTDFQGFWPCNLAGLQQPLFSGGGIARSRGKEHLFWGKNLKNLSSNAVEKSGKRGCGFREGRMESSYPDAGRINPY